MSINSPSPVQVQNQEQEQDQNQDPPSTKQPDSTVKLETPTPTPSESTVPASAPAPAPVPAPASTPTPTPTPVSSSSSDFIHLPSYSSWFSFNDIHQCEVRFLPEFFDSRSPSKNPNVYKYIRNSILKHFRHTPSGSGSGSGRKITFTDIRRTLVADVGSVRRVFDFLEAWGLINYSPSSFTKPLKWDDKSSSSSEPDSSSDLLSKTNRLCSGCKSVCTIACFACDKFDLTLCARCYVRGNYRVGVSSSDFRRVEINDEPRTHWTDKETLHLLEALMNFGDDWKKVSQHVSGRTDKECVSQFLKLPLGEQFLPYPDSDNIHNNATADLILDTSLPSKRIRLSPLADASNPIMAQAAFLSSLVGVDVAEAAAHAAVNKLYDMGFEGSREGFIATPKNVGDQGNDGSSCGGVDAMTTREAMVDANSQIEKDELDVERAISQILNVQMKEIVDKLVRFEELDLQMEKEHQQLDQMKNMLFVDQLNHLFNKSCIPANIKPQDDANVRLC